MQRCGQRSVRLRRRPASKEDAKRQPTIGLAELARLAELALGSAVEDVARPGCDVGVAHRSFNRRLLVGRDSDVDGLVVKFIDRLGRTASGWFFLWCHSSIIAVMSFLASGYIFTIPCLDAIFPLANK